MVRADPQVGSNHVFLRFSVSVWVAFKMGKKTIKSGNKMLHIYIKLLFTMMVSHSYVPEAFGVGIIKPVLKDKSGDLSSLDNYRPITLSPVFSKLFELVLICIYGYLIVSDDLEFGYKRN